MLRAFIVLSALLLAEFVVVFYGTDLAAAQRSGRMQVGFAWETAIPFHRWAFLVYFSVFALPFSIPFVVRERSELRRWGLRMATTIAVAGLVFLVFPAQLEYPPDTGGGRIVGLARSICGTYNLLPSLHVALTVVIIASLWPHLGKRGKWLFSGWGAALLASTLLTHQHHVLDVVAGLALSCVVCLVIRINAAPS